MKYISAEHFEDVVNHIKDVTFKNNNVMAYSSACTILDEMKKYYEDVDNSECRLRKDKIHRQYVDKLNEYCKFHECDECFFQSEADEHGDDCPFTIPPSYYDSYFSD